MSDEDRELRPLRNLLARLEVEPLDRDLFLGDPGRGEGRLFGGMVAAQSVMAAGRTVPEDAGNLHSLHAYFLRPGRHDVPIRFVVDRIRDGRTFTTRRVVAHQAGEAIFNLATSFARPEEGISHQDPMPEAPEPDSLPDWEGLRAALLGKPEARRGAGPIEVRVCDPEVYEKAYATRQAVWMRARGPLPDEPLIHTALLAYGSDRTLLSTAALPHGLFWGKRMSASLDHAVWIHRIPRFDRWVLYASHTPAAHSARGLVFGAMYDEEGQRVASIAQEGLVRVPRKD